jgi:hypothetical protein
VLVQLKERADKKANKAKYYKETLIYRESELEKKDQLIQKLTKTNDE